MSLEPAAQPVHRTFVYVDGFNLYYRALKGSTYKWLNLLELARSVLRPANHILKIRYFTAMVSGKVDYRGLQRQQVYHRALATVPEIEIHLGSFVAHQKWARLSVSPVRHFRPAPDLVSILRIEEKGSDVNLASWLLRDAFRDEFDVAVVVSNDSDLVEPIRMARAETGKAVGLICPDSSVSRSLGRVARFCRFLSAGRLAAAQFPEQIADTTISRPPEWAPRPPG